MRGRGGQFPPRPKIPLIEGRFREAILKAEWEVASRGGS
jgi:hypothetical protein